MNNLITAFGSCMLIFHAHEPSVGSDQASDVRICSFQCCQCDSELLSAVLVGFWSLVSINVFHIIYVIFHVFGFQYFHIFLFIFSGSAAANTFAQVFSCIALFFFIRWQRLHEKTWGGEFCGCYFETVVCKATCLPIFKIPSQSTFCYFSLFLEKIKF